MGHAVSYYRGACGVFYTGSQSYDIVHSRCILKYTAVIVIIFCSFIRFIHAEETYNLDIVFRCTAWDSFPNLHSYGVSLAGGDVNGDGYSDIAVEALHYIDSIEYWGIDVYVFFGAPIMDSIYDAVLHCPINFGHDPCAIWIGDVNGDSIGDVIVGDLGGGGGCGDVWVFFGGSPFDTVPDLHLVGELPGSAFGNAVTTGDINGDGCDDIIVGAYAYNGFTLDGRVYVYYGGALLDPLVDIIIDGQGSESMGITVGSGGDLNSDGFEDIVVGAMNNSEVTWCNGKVYVFFGGNPMNTWPDCWLHGEGFNHYLGWTGCDIMRVQNDHDMLITSTSFYPNGFPNTCPGKVYILNGGSPMDTLPDLWMIGYSDYSILGIWCCSAGDVDGDGNDDALVGAPNDYKYRGTGYVWRGGMSMDTIPDAYLRGGFTGQDIGWKVASAGDIDGDGRDEVLFSNYAGVAPTVWACTYTGPAVQEQVSQTITPVIQIKPNPFSRAFFIRYNDFGNHDHIDVHMYDITGREVMAYVVRDIVRMGISVDARHLPCGVYFVSVISGSHYIVEKVIKID